MGIIKSVWTNLLYALDGLKFLVRTQKHFRFHIFAAICVIITSVLLHLSKYEWYIVVLCMGIVLGAEAMNTAVEVLADRVEPEKDRMIKTCKDVAAASVALTALCAAIIGCMIFIPKFYALLF